MKSIRFAVLVMIFAALAASLAGCGKLGDDDILGGACDISAKIDGTSYCGEGWFAYYPEDEYLNIYGSQDDPAAEFIISIKKPVLGKSYNLDVKNEDSYASHSADDKIYYSFSGTVKLTKFTTTRAEGTFSFTGFTLDNGLKKEITNGKFSVNKI